MTVADVYKALWRHKLLILVLTGLVVALTWFATEQRTKIYKSSVLVRVSQPVNDASPPTVTVCLDLDGPTYLKGAQTRASLMLPCRIRGSDRPGHPVFAPARSR